MDQSNGLEVVEDIIQIFLAKIEIRLFGIVMLELQRESWSNL